MFCSILLIEIHIFKFIKIPTERTNQPLTDSDILYGISKECLWATFGRSTLKLTVQNYIFNIAK